MALFKNSANIIVQNRMTGQLEEEKMQVYVRLGIRLLYKVDSSVTTLAFILTIILRVRKVEWKVLEVSINNTIVCAYLKEGYSSSPLEVNVH